jgi:curved DNA-binding protein CbpA
MEIKDWLENDYYHLLGVRQNASPEEINKAYRVKAKSTHPDAFPINSEEYIFADRKFKQLLLARDTLLDPEMKDEYDQERLTLQQCYLSYMANSYSLPLTAKTEAPKASSFKEQLKQKLTEIGDNEYVFSHDEQAFIPKNELEEFLSKEEKAMLYKKDGAKKFYAMGLRYLGYRDYRRAMVYFRSAQHLDPKIRIPSHYFPDK